MVVGINGSYGFIGYHLWLYLNYKCDDIEVIRLSKNLDKDLEKKEKGNLKIKFLDTKEGLKNLSGDEAFYIEILYNFLTDYKGYEKTLESLYSEADEGDMLIEAHTIKGLAATIGATELHKDTEYFDIFINQF